jgi:hypothetical protein
VRQGWRSLLPFGVIFRALAGCAVRYESVIKNCIEFLEPSVKTTIEVLGNVRVRPGTKPAFVDLAGLVNEE